MGSVKDLHVIKEANGSESGSGRFSFSDRYSIFDWGEMPDLIDGKGAALCMTSAYFFEKLEGRGIKTHYAGVVENGVAKKLSELSGPQSEMEISLVRVVRPTFENGKYDYSVFTKEKTNLLIPLEVIYRNSLPEGSSVFRRLKDGSLKLSDIGLSEMPSAGSVLKTPILVCSTKLESSDRYMGWNEAQEISGMTKAEIEALKNAVVEINSLITSEAKKAGLVNEDGKVEFGYNGNRELVLLDTLGTLDECRFTFGGMPVSKEILRMHYRDTQWHHEVEATKKMGPGWKSHVKSAPAKLPPQLKKLISQVYKASCNEIIGREWFKGVPKLQDVLREITK